MKNFVQCGLVVTLVATAAVASGGGMLAGSIFGVAHKDTANGAEGDFALTGVFDLPRTTGANTDWTAGTKLYWDNATKTITKTAGGNTLIGVALTASAVGDAFGRVRLNGSF